MEFLLLILAALSFVLRVEFIHVILMLVHIAVAMWIVRCWVTRRPLMCLFILSYLAMYFPNPIAIMLGWIPLEYTTTQSIFFTSNAMQMAGLDPGSDVPSNTCGGVVRSLAARPTALTRDTRAFSMIFESESG